MSVVFNRGMSKPEVQPRQEYNLTPEQISHGFAQSKDRVTRIRSTGNENLTVQIAKESEGLLGLAMQMHTEIKNLQGENKVLKEKLDKLEGKTPEVKKK